VFQSFRLNQRFSVHGQPMFLRPAYNLFKYCFTVCDEIVVTAKIKYLILSECWAEIANHWIQIHHGWLISCRKVSMVGIHVNCHNIN
jgi:hypothetical protein